MKCPSCGAYIANDMKKCEYCGTPNDSYAAPHKESPPHENVEEIARKVYHEEAKRAVPVQSNVVNNVVNEYHTHTHVQRKSEKSRFILLFLLLFGGMIGLHKFYQGKTGMGVLYLFTGGICVFGVAIDLLVVLFGTPKDKNGLPIRWL